MANAPPDIVLGVALAADPEKYRAAVERLRRMSAQGTAAADAVPGTSGAAAHPSGATARPAAAPASGPPRIAHSTSRQTRNPGDAFGQLEAFVLQTFIQSMLPKDAQHVFGRGTAGEVWKSMLAEKLAHEIASSGQMGLAKRLAAGRPELAASRSEAAGPGAAGLARLSSASVASALLAGQDTPRQGSEAVETTAPQPASPSERS